MAKEQRYCATDEILEAALGRFKFEDWKGLTEEAKKKLTDLPDYIKKRIYDKGFADANDAYELALKADTRKTNQLKRGIISNKSAEQVAAENEQLASVMGRRERGQILPVEAAAATNQAILQRLEFMRDRGFEFADLIRKGGNEETYAGAKQLVEVIALAKQLAGNQSEAGRLLQYSKKMFKDRAASNELISLFGRFGC